MVTQVSLVGLGAVAVSEAAVALELPYLAAFLGSVEVLQSRPSGGGTRAYLDAVVRDGWFEIVSPSSGLAVRSGGSLVLVDRIGIDGQAVPFAKVFAVGFPGEPDLLLGIGDVSLGYPICAAFLRRRGVLLGLAATEWGFGARHLQALERLIVQDGWVPVARAEPLWLVTGDANFAHHCWNQLSGLEDFADRQAAAAPFQMVTTHQPLGPIADLFAGLVDVTACSEDGLEAMNRPGRMFLPVGGRVLQRSLAERVVRFAQGRMSAVGRAIDTHLAAVAGPVIWLSVRTRNRTPVNQHALLMALGGALARLAPDGAIVLDGHSVPDDLDRYARYHRDEAEIATAADRIAAEAIRDALVAAGDAPAGGVHVAVGLKVGDSIALAQRAAFYVCHHGTVQHKIGWFTAASGVVHTNRAVIDMGPGPWVAAQSEMSVEPVYLPASLVDDTGDDATELAALLRQGGYRVRDIEAAVRFVVEQARMAFMQRLAGARMAR